MKFKREEQVANNIYLIATIDLSHNIYPVDYTNGCFFMCDLFHFLIRYYSELFSLANSRIALNSKNKTLLGVFSVNENFSSNITMHVKYRSARADAYSPVDKILIKELLKDLDLDWEIDVK